MKVNKVMFVVCGNAGTSYWRFQNFHLAGYRTGKMFSHTLFWDKNEVEMAPWQHMLSDNRHLHQITGLLYGAAREADAIVFQRVETEFALTAFYAMRDQFPDKPILSEIDDDITDVASYNLAAECLKPGSPMRTFALAQFRNSDGIIVSTPYLKEIYQEYCPHIYVVPNSIDTQKWDAAPRKNKKGIRFGWIGGATHDEDLRILESVIPRVLDKVPDGKFVFVSSRSPEFLQNVRGVEVVNKWSPILKYQSHLAAQDFDIGLAPLRDNKFNRAKSNLRWLEYSALGIPSVCSNVGHFAQTIKHGVDGMLANEPDQFADHIIALAKDSNMRKAIGKAAHARIASDFNVDKTVEIYSAAIDDVLTRTPLAAPSMMTGVDMDTPSLPMTMEVLPG